MCLLLSGFRVLGCWVRFLSVLELTAKGLGFTTLTYQNLLFCGVLIIDPNMECIRTLHKSRFLQCLCRLPGFFGKRCPWVSLGDPGTHVN